MRIDFFVDQLDLFRTLVCLANRKFEQALSPIGKLLIQVYQIETHIETKDIVHPPVCFLRNYTDSKSLVNGIY